MPHLVERMVQGILRIEEWLMAFGDPRDLASIGEFENALVVRMNLILRETH